MGLYPQVPGARVGVACRVSLRAEKEMEALISSSAQGNAQLMRSVVHVHCPFLPLPTFYLSLTASDVHNDGWTAEEKIRDGNQGHSSNWLN